MSTDLFSIRLQVGHYSHYYRCIKFELNDRYIIVYTKDEFERKRSISHHQHIILNYMFF